MSIKVQELVWAHYPGAGTELLIALRLACYAHDDGSSVYPAVDTLQRLIRQKSRRTVQTNLARMRSKGFLVVVSDAKGGRGRTTRYRIDLEWLRSAPATAQLATSKERGSQHPMAGRAQAAPQSAQFTTEKSAEATAPEQSLNSQEKSEQQQGSCGRSRSATATTTPKPLPAGFALDEALLCFARERGIDRVEEKFDIWLRWARKAKGAYDWDENVRHALLTWPFNELRPPPSNVDLDELARSFIAGRR